MSETTNKEYTNLMGGISFLDPNLIGDEKKAVVLKSAKKNNAAQTFQQLLDAVTQGDVDGVRDTVESMKEKPGAGWMKRITKALVLAKPFNHPIADILDQVDVITNHLLITVGREEKDFDFLSWMLSSLSRIKKAEFSVGRASHDNNRKSVAYLVESLIYLDQLETASKLDLGTILRDSQSKNSVMGGGHWIIRVIQNNNENGSVGAFIEKMLSNETIGKVIGTNDLKAIREQRLYICNQLANNMSHNSLDNLAGVERAMRKSPTLASAWNDYWTMDQETLPGSGIARFNPLLFQSITQKMQIDIDSSSDPIEYLLLRGNSSIRGALSKKGPLPDALYQRLMKGNGHQVHVVVSNARSEDIVPLITHLMGRMGVDWKDSLGRGWGHTLTQSNDDINIKHIQSFMRDPNGIKLLTSPDSSGKTAIEMLEFHPKFKDNQNFLTRAKRNLLNSVVSKGPGSKAPRNRPSI